MARVETRRLVKVASRFRHDDALAEAHRRVGVMLSKFGNAPHHHVRRYRHGRHFWWAIYIDTSRMHEAPTAPRQTHDVAV